MSKITPLKEELRQLKVLKKRRRNRSPTKTKHWIKKEMMKTWKTKMILDSFIAGICELCNNDQFSKILNLLLKLLGTRYHLYSSEIPKNQPSSRNGSTC